MSIEGQFEEAADAVDRWLRRKAARNACFRYYREWNHDPIRYRAEVMAQGGFTLFLLVFTLGLTLVPSGPGPSHLVLRTLMTFSVILLTWRMFIISLVVVGSIQGFQRSQELIGPEDARVIEQSLALLKASDRRLPVASPERRSAIQLSRTLRGFRIASGDRRPTLWLLFHTVLQVQKVTSGRARHHN